MESNLPEMQHYVAPDDISAQPEPPIIPMPQPLSMTVPIHFESEIGLMIGLQSMIQFFQQRIPADEVKRAVNWAQNKYGG